jgi:TrmH family RNA methyltransferase
MDKCILVEPEIEGNLGFLARTMANFSIDELILVDPDFQIGKEARNRAMHAQDILDNVKIYDTFDAALTEVDTAVGTTGIDSSRNALRNSITPEQMATRRAEVEGDVGIVLGRESKGLSNDELERCDLVVTIPTSEDYPVMNITHAAAVVFYELFKHTEAEEKERLSGRDQKETLENIFKAMMNRLHYSEDYRERTQTCLENLIGRSFLYEQEANTLIGFFKQVNEELGDT